MSSGKSRGYCMTWNNYTDENIAEVYLYYDLNVNVTYLIIGFEKGERAQTSHMQIYVYHTNPVSFTKMKESFPHCHIEAQKSKRNVEAYCYCMEDGDYVEFGNRPRQGHRTDLEVIKFDIMEGKSMLSISKEYFSQFCQYSRQFRMFADMYEQDKRVSTALIIYDDKTLKLGVMFDEIMRREYFNKSKLYTPTETSLISAIDLLYLIKCKTYECIFWPLSCLHNGYADILQDVITEYLSYDNIECQDEQL